MGGVSSIQFFLGFLELFNFAKPLMYGDQTKSMLAYLHVRLRTCAFKCVLVRASECRPLLYMRFENGINEKSGWACFKLLFSQKHDIATDF